eukprot:COSAG04_NODE_4377_length_2130_cov_2.554407_2_plen_79_part_00
MWFHQLTEKDTGRPDGIFVGKKHECRGGALDFEADPESLKRAANNMEDVSRNNKAKKKRLTVESFEWPNAGNTGHWAG